MWVICVHVTLWSFFFFQLDCTTFQILVPQPGIEPQWKCQVLTTGPPGNFLLSGLLNRGPVAFSQGPRNLVTSRGGQASHVGRRDPPLG